MKEPPAIKPTREPLAPVNIRSINDMARTTAQMGRHCRCHSPLRATIAATAAYRPTPVSRSRPEVRSYQPPEGHVDNFEHQERGESPFDDREPFKKGPGAFERSDQGFPHLALIWTTGVCFSQRKGAKAANFVIWGGETSGQTSCGPLRFCAFALNVPPQGPATNPGPAPSGGNPPHPGRLWPPPEAPPHGTAGQKESHWSGYPRR